MIMLKMILDFNKSVPSGTLFACMEVSKAKQKNKTSNSSEWHVTCLDKSGGSGRVRKLVLATHGELAKGMQNSLKMIVGDLANEIETYSLYPGESPNDYYEQLKNRITQSEEQFIIVCDIKGGSVHTTLSKLIVYSNVTVISGMNMNMVLDLVLTYQSGLSEKDCANLMASAKDGITILNNSLIDSEDEDF